MFNPATPTAEAVLDFHNFLFLILMPLLILVLWLQSRIVFFSWLLPRHLPSAAELLWRPERFRAMRLLRSHEVLEFVWAAVPALLLLYMGSVSLHLLYLVDELSDPAVTFRAVGHQWYWSYQYSHLDRSGVHLSHSFDSYLLGEDGLRDSSGSLKDRLWATDAPAPLPLQTPVRLLTTSVDVIHSWALPAAAVKVDSIPGRLNQALLHFRRPGRFFGQCSELCGANHGFMPIEVKVLEVPDYLDWVRSTFLPRVA